MYYANEVALVLVSLCVGWLIHYYSCEERGKSVLGRVKSALGRVDSAPGNFFNACVAYDNDFLGFIVFAAFALTAFFVGVAFFIHFPYLISLVVVWFVHKACVILKAYENQKKNY